jgi:hypothetical protein
MGIQTPTNCRHRADDGVLNPFIHPLFRSEFNSEFWLLTPEFCLINKSTVSSAYWSQIWPEQEEEQVAF